MNKSDLLKKISLSYQDNLWKCPRILNYLVFTRGLKEETIKKYRLGYSNNSLQLSNNLIEDAKNIGVIKKNNTEFFNNYITFPIFEQDIYYNIYGRASFVDLIPHKTLPDIPKDHLYNQEALKVMNEIIIVESPIDCLTLQQYEFNSCAVMGTKLSNQNLEKFKNKKCYILFDRDAAGNLGSKKVASQIFKIVDEVHLLYFPAKSDIKIDVNSYFLKYGINAKSDLKFWIKISEALKASPFAIFKNKKTIKKNRAATPKIEDSRLKMIKITEVGRKLFENKYFIDRGEELWVKCPFHKNGYENNKSLWIGGKKNIWYCFGCLKGGDVIGLVSWFYKISLDNAKQWLIKNFL